MTSEIRNCQNCHKEFAIDSEDFAFYEKLNVPPPTWCPDCRLQRRLLFMNERGLYRRNCDLCGKNMVAMYPKDKSFRVYCNPCWWSDKLGRHAICPRLRSRQALSLAVKGVE